MNLLAFPEDVRGLVRAVRACRVPVSALTIGAALTTGVVLEVIWSGALRTLERDGHDWQVFTAPFVQDGGITGAVFNLASALIVIALTAWIWGDWAPQPISSATACRRVTQPRTRQGAPVQPTSLPARCARRCCCLPEIAAAG
jgi:hypothetical protein